MTACFPPGQQFVYHVDHNDIVVSCDAAWLRFAQEHGAPELDVSRVIGRSLWDFIATAETRSLYHLLVAKSRAAQTSVAVSFRCDGPTCRRAMRLTITPLVDNQLMFTSVLVEEEPRPYVALLDTTLPRSDTYLTLCSWCKQVLVEGHG